VSEADAGVLVASFKEVRVPSEVIAGCAAVVTVPAVVAVSAFDLKRFVIVIFLVVAGAVESTMARMSSVAG
jgi:hypothetical protein